MSRTKETAAAVEPKPIDTKSGAAVHARASTPSLASSTTASTTDSPMAGAGAGAGAFDPAQSALPSLEALAERFRSLREPSDSATASKTVADDYVAAFSYAATAASNYKQITAMLRGVEQEKHRVLIQAYTHLHTVINLCNMSKKAELKPYNAESLNALIEIVHKNAAALIKPKYKTAIQPL